MAEIYTDPGVFIRSMATRGALGGLARATCDAVRRARRRRASTSCWSRRSASGRTRSTSSRAADTVAVVLVPGLGDDIQAIKAGILEIADVFVVNKADREGADRVVAELSMMLDFAGRPGVEAADRQDLATTERPACRDGAALEAHGAFLGVR